VKPWAYYNDVDEKKCAWVRELIKAGAITDGEVDCRPIELIQPNDLRGFRRAHFFCGIAIWDYALNLAGWDDSIGVTWTFSCPCQPFSAAGKKKGIADRRHLFPEQFRLIKGRRPVVCFGEQVSSPDGLAWLDIVRTDLESEAYTFGALDLCAAGAGAPHIRNRTFFVADAKGRGCGIERDKAQPGSSRHTDSGNEFDGLADAKGIGRRRGADNNDGGRRQRASGQNGTVDSVGNPDSAGSQGRRIGRDGTGECAPGSAGVAGGMAYPDGGQFGNGPIQRSREYGLQPEDGSPAGPVNGFWRDAGWVLCRPERSDGDPSWRPVEPRTFPLGDGNSFDLGRMRDSSAPGYQSGKAEARIMRLRGYGDAISPEVAARFIKAYASVRK
jgi:DNA (cytosine-5)-methyltransferase 1